LNYRALDYRFSVEVGPFNVVGRLLQSLADPVGSADHHYRISGNARAATLERDGTTLCADRPEASILDALIQDLNAQAATSRPDHLVLHAAAVARDGAGLLLPGSPGRGKSTLAAALVRAGFGYLTDEAAAVDLDSLRVSPYPKPLSLGSNGTQTLVAAEELRPGGLSPAVAVRAIVFPFYDPGETAELVPMSRAEAAIELANNSFNFLDHGAPWLPRLARLVEASWCGRMQMGDLDEAVELIGASRW
jgi:hypothetical protein